MLDAVQTLFIIDDLQNTVSILGWNSMKKHTEKLQHAKKEPLNYVNIGYCDEILKGQFLVK